MHASRASTFVPKNQAGFAQELEQLREFRWIINCVADAAPVLAKGCMWPDF